MSIYTMAPAEDGANNLVTNVRDSIVNIKWTVYGKISGITKGVSNTKVIGPAPTEQFTAFRDFKGPILHMHHLNQENKIGIALPKELHTGKGFTSLWHKFGAATSILGMMLTVYQQAYGQDPLLVGDFTDAKWHEDELMMAKAGLGQNDYQQVVRFARANNSRTGSMRQGTVGIYYASENEMANFQFFNLSQAGPGTFVVGGWNAYYQDAAQASARLNKTVTHAVIFFQQNGSKGFTPVNVIEMIKPEEMPTNKVHNTFTNKLQ